MKKDGAPGSPKRQLTAGGPTNNNGVVVEEKAMSSEQKPAAVISPPSGVSSVDGSVDTMGRPKRRGKREKSITVEHDEKPATIDIPPRPEKKNMFCCFKW